MSRLAELSWVMLVWAAVGHAEERAAPLRRAVASELKKLSSADPIERQRAYDVLFEIREDIHIHLLKLAGGAYEEGTDLPDKELAIDLLGEYRDHEALDVLIDNLTFRPRTIIISSRNLMFELEHPSVRALMKIGLPAEPAVVQALKVSRDEPRAALLQFVLKDIRANREEKVRAARFRYRDEEPAESREVPEPPGDTEPASATSERGRPSSTRTPPSLSAIPNQEERGPPIRTSAGHAYPLLAAAFAIGVLLGVAGTWLAWAFRRHSGDTNHQ